MLHYRARSGVQFFFRWDLLRCHLCKLVPSKIRHQLISSALGRSPEEPGGFNPKLTAMNGLKPGYLSLQLSTTCHEVVALPKVVAIPEKEVPQYPFGGALCHRLKLDLT